MPLKILSAFLLFASLIIVGCASVHNSPDLVVIGNSITRYAPNPAIGWSGDWGAAAPTADKDFSHIVAAALHVPLSVNGLGIETPPQTVGQIPALANKVHPGTTVVLELGDNAAFSGDLPGFASAYNQLATATSKGKSLVCVSTFWHYADVDAIIKSACETNQGHYAFIGDIFTDPANPDRTSTAFSFWGISIHPQAWGHQQIAERVLSQINHH